MGADRRKAPTPVPVPPRLRLKRPVYGDRDIFAHYILGTEEKVSERISCGEGGTGMPVGRKIERVTDLRLYKREHFRHSLPLIGLYNTYSSTRPIRAGVPQGSTLSPLLYSAYVNDISRPSTGVQLTLFADDTTLYLMSNSIRNILPRLQRVVDELTQ
ncbi:RNA-directed DNA polymerase from mobile element jockey [Eumeta japonica]|uniref:RNA-directed DNA polymerase from mobile element jockey n=1 Tax=Eumeta variegata TaxID=151549 RepID=A0A4C1W2G0_EUMVA|nr:RNA-directed DNA polymerase from mobile element jockey [Eumeta japonica]